MLSGGSACTSAGRGPAARFDLPLRATLACRLAMARPRLLDVPVMLAPALALVLAAAARAPRHGRRGPVAVSDRRGEPLAAAAEADAGRRRARQRRGDPLRPGPADGQEGPRQPDRRGHREAQAGGPPRARSCGTWTASCWCRRRSPAGSRPTPGGRLGLRPAPHASTRTTWTGRASCWSRASTRSGSRPSCGSS